MQIYHHITDYKIEKPVLTIGSFDGVHLGHRKVIDKLKAIAQDKGGETVIFTFHPHPKVALSSDEGKQELRMLTTIDERTRLFEQAGVDHLIIYPFTKEFAKLSYIDFVRTILVEKLNVNTLVLGYDHRLGKDREGNFDTLLKLSVQYGFKLEKLDALFVDDNNVSSTKIRKALQAGKVQKAKRYLGYAYELSGTVIKGKQLGRKIQFPTANIKLNDKLKLVPKDGVYIVECSVMDKTYAAMLNIGTRPTVNNNLNNRSIEVHLLHFQADIYGQNISVKFIDRLRDEQKFNSIEELRQQLQADKNVVEKWLTVNESLNKDNLIEAD
ncbi:MAG: bifunctional riboflavin kinase/FAD synthetase [Mangrovibacterium sp.]